MAEWSERLHQEFRSQRVSWSSLVDYALNETPFKNPKSMLASLEKLSRIRVASRDLKRRKGTFKEETLIDYIEFV